MENYKVDKKNSAVAIRINPKIYPVNVIMRAANKFTADAYVNVNGNPRRDMTIKFFVNPKENFKKEDFINLVREFHNELINASVEELRFKESAAITNTLITRALEDSPKEEKKLKIKW